MCRCPAATVRTVRSVHLASASVGRGRIENRFWRADGSPDTVEGDAAEGRVAGGCWEARRADQGASEVDAARYRVAGGGLAALVSPCLASMGQDFFCTEQCLCPNHKVETKSLGGYHVTKRCLRREGLSIVNTEWVVAAPARVSSVALFAEGLQALLSHLVLCYILGLHSEQVPKSHYVCRPRIQPLV